MAKVYTLAEYRNGDNVDGHFSNLSKVWRRLHILAGENQIFHGTPAMDNFRLVKVSNYAGLLKALERENYNSCPLFWNDDGANRVMRLTRSKLL